MTNTATTTGKAPAITAANPALSYRTRNGVLLVVALVETGHSVGYRTSVCYGSTGMEVGILSQTFDTEATARAVARTWAVRFNAGLTIAQACDEAEAAGPAPTEDLDTYRQPALNVDTIAELRERFTPIPVVDPMADRWVAFDRYVDRCQIAA